MASKNKTKSAKNEDLKFFGMPMSWDWRNAHKDIWNPGEDRVFPPKRFGIGWGVNVHALLKKARVLN